MNILALAADRYTTALVHLLIVGIICGIVYWALTQFPIAEPFGKVCRVIVLAIFAIAVIFTLLGFL